MFQADDPTICELPFRVSRAAEGDFANFGGLKRNWLSDVTEFVISLDASQLAGSVEGRLYRAVFDSISMTIIRVKHEIIFLSAQIDYSMMNQLHLEGFIYWSTELDRMIIRRVAYQ